MNERKSYSHRLKVDRGHGERKSRFFVAEKGKSIGREGWDERKIVEGVF